MNKIVKILTVLGLCLVLGGVVAADRARAADDAVSRHMVAQAMLTAHFIAAALKAGMSEDQIDAALTKVAEGSAISEFWISDEKGRIEFTNIPGTSFKFPTDPAGKSQAAPFAKTAGEAAERASDAPSPAGAGTPPSSSGAAKKAASPRPSGATAVHDFYLRAGLALDGSGPTRFKDVDCSSTIPPALYACGNGIDGAPLSSLGDFETKAGVDLGLGYVAAPALRLEAVVQHRPRFSFDGRANFRQTTDRQDVSAKLSTLTGMLAAYVDLPALGLPRLGPFSPFAGAGAGLSRIRIDETHMEFPRTRTVVPGGRRTGFAWMATAGFAVSLGDRVTLDLAWRYTDYGTVETEEATGRIEFRDGRPPILLPLARTKAELRRHGFTASLRYAF